MNNKSKILFLRIMIAMLVLFNLNCKSKSQGLISSKELEYVGYLMLMRQEKEFDNEGLQAIHKSPPIDNTIQMRKGKQPDDEGGQVIHKKEEDCLSNIEDDQDLDIEDDQDLDWEGSCSRCGRTFGFFYINTKEKNDCLGKERNSSPDYIPCYDCKSYYCQDKFEDGESFSSISDGSDEDSEEDTISWVQNNPVNERYKLTYFFPLRKKYGFTTKRTFYYQRKPKNIFKFIRLRYPVSILSKK